jgi:hypothetical protein
VLAAYLLIRLRAPIQYIRKGAEEELITTYTSLVLAVEDVIANFFTFLYITLDNYLPSFVSASNSLVYLGSATILREQHGYHESHTHLVAMSHLFLWRFYAGVAVTLFLGAATWAAVHAWRWPSLPAMITTALCVMVLTGFSTHLLIKMRPYNSVPALSYKVVLSVAPLTVLIAYLATIQIRRSALIMVVWGCVFMAALTRPGMQGALLAEVGLIGYRDPLGEITRALR